MEIQPRYDTDPDVHIVVEIGPSIAVHDDDGTGGAWAVVEAAVIRGEAVDVLEQLSIRRPFDHDVAVDQQWMVGGLAEVFETDPG